MTLFYDSENSALLIPILSPILTEFIGTFTHFCATAVSDMDHGNGLKGAGAYSW